MLTKADLKYSKNCKIVKFYDNFVPLMEKLNF